MAITEQRLPYGVGRVTRPWLGWITVLGALSALGFYAYSREVTQGMIVTGLRNIGTMNGATWGLDVAFVVYFVGLSFAGISTAALIRLANLNALRPIARMAEVLTVVSLVLAAFAILYDLGQPIRGMVNLLRYGRPASPFFGTFTLVISGYLFASLVYLYLDGRRDAAICARTPGRLQRFHRVWAADYRDTPRERERHSRASLWLAIAVVPLLVVAHSTLGFVFGLQAGRPGWYSALQAPAFVALAGVSGVGMLAMIAAVARRTLPDGELLGEQIFRWLGRLLLLLLLGYLYFLVVEMLTVIYASPEREAEIGRALLYGRYAWIYWTSVAFLVIPTVALGAQAILRRVSMPTIVAAGVLVNLAAMGKRFLIVVPSQTLGTLLPYGEGRYSPSWVEYAEVVGLLAFGAVLFMLFGKVFPIMHIERAEEASEG